MAITYPLTLPAAPGNRSIQWEPKTRVGQTASPYTAEQQTFAWPAQWWEATVELPPMTDAQAGAWVAFFLACNGREGTFYFGDSVRRAPLGNIAGAVKVGSGAVANSTTLPLTGGTGLFALGDWLAVGTKLHRVIQVNAGSVEVFPRLRSAYAVNTAVATSSPKGLFRLVDLPSWLFDERKIAGGLTFSVREVLP